MIYRLLRLLNRNKIEIPTNKKARFYLYKTKGQNLVGKKLLFRALDPFVEGKCLTFKVDKDKMDMLEHFEPGESYAFEVDQLISTSFKFLRIKGFTIKSQSKDYYSITCTF